MNAQIHVWPDMEHPNELGTGVSSAATRVAALYEAKTAAILHRYGPGPRVHYHTGFIDESAAAPTPESLRARLVRSQEEMLKYASNSWNLQNAEFRDILDVGCGLGGTAIFLAQELGTRVTAITVAPSHVELIANFARQAGVASQVVPMLCDASAVPGTGCFDAAIAIESSSLFSRRPWFKCIARVLRPRGRAFVFDCFLKRSEYKEPFDRHWCAQIGTLEEYVSAARDAGFRLVATEDTSSRTATFWTATVALIQAEVDETRPERSVLPAIKESLATHDLMRRGLLDGGLRQMLLTFAKI